MGTGLTVYENSPKILISESHSSLSIGQLGGDKLVVIGEGGDEVSLSPIVQNLIIQNLPAHVLTIRNVDGPSLHISQSAEAGETSPFGQPYYQAEDTQFYYFSWQHSDGSNWEAQRFDNNSFEIITRAGLNPQPRFIADFQALSW